MEISERANLIFNNGSIVVRHAFKTRDGKFHDIVVTDGAHEFQKKDWTGCEKVLLKKIWAVYSECIQVIQKHDVLKKYAPEHVRFVYSKNPSKSNPDRTKLFINSLNSSLPPKQHSIGHLPKINEELDILSTILLKPCAMVLPPKPEPAVKTTTTKAAKPKKGTPEKAAEPEKLAEPGKKPAKCILAGDGGAHPKSTVKLPPVRPEDRPEEDLAAKPAPADASKRSPANLPPVRRPPVDPEVERRKKEQEQGAKTLLSLVRSSLGSAFNQKPLHDHLVAAKTQ